MTPEAPPLPPFGLVKDAFGRLMLIDTDGVRHANVRPVRAFPLTDPAGWISLRDERGQELVCVDDPQRLPEQVRKVLLEDLAQHDFIPKIRKIHRIARAAQGFDWDIDTDRGPTTIHLESDDAIHPLGPGQLVLIDAHNIRYLIPNVRALDRASRRRLERYY
jgi:hypothetical protein